MKRSHQPSIRATWLSWGLHMYSSLSSLIHATIRRSVGSGHGPATRSAVPKMSMTFAARIPGPPEVVSWKMLLCLRLASFCFFSAFRDIEGCKNQSRVREYTCRVSVPSLHLAIICFLSAGIDVEGCRSKSKITKYPSWRCPLHCIKVGFSTDLIPRSVQSGWRYVSTLHAAGLKPESIIWAGSRLTDD